MHESHSTETESERVSHVSQSHKKNQSFWMRVVAEMEAIDPEKEQFKEQELPVTRIKKVMKLENELTDDPQLKNMISGEAPLLFAKACEIFILELGLRAWAVASDSNRRTLLKSDICKAVTLSDMYDFLIDIVPREEFRLQEYAVEQSQRAGAQAYFEQQRQASSLRQLSNDLSTAVTSLPSSFTTVPPPLSHTAKTQPVSLPAPAVSATSSGASRGTMASSTHHTPTILSTAVGVSRSSVVASNALSLSSASSVPGHAPENRDSVVVNTSYSGSMNTTSGMRLVSTLGASPSTGIGAFTARGTSGQATSFEGNHSSSSSSSSGSGALAPAPVYVSSNPYHAPPVHGLGTTPTSTTPIVINTVPITHTSVEEFHSTIAEAVTSVVGAVENNASDDGESEPPESGENRKRSAEKAGLEDARDSEEAV